MTYKPESHRNWSHCSKFASLLLAVAACSFANRALADTATTNTFNTVGTGTWTCPAGVSLVQVEVWGGGGASGGALKTSAPSAKNGDGGGGGGGAYARFSTFGSTSGSNYTYSVGAGGVGVFTNNGTAGSDSWFISNTTLDAAGGLGGGAGIGISSNAFAVGNGEGVGGSGGAPGATGDTQFAGGAGANAVNSTSAGGGGGSGGSANAGNAATASAGAAAVTGGGAGGSGGNGTLVIQTGFTPGGGGGGSRSTSAGSGAAGTNGASGQVQFTYYATPTTQASGVTFSAIGSSAMTVSWTPGNVGSSLVLVSSNSPVSGTPINGTVYTPNAAFGSGSQIGNGYAVYQATGNSVTISGLSIGTTYYVAVYAVNGAGTALAEFLTTTPATGSQATISAPSVTSPTKSAIATTTATLGATVTSANGGTITNYGIVWATTPNPTIANNAIQAGTSVTPPDTFTVSATGLPAGSTIYYAGYASSAAGTGYSLADSFSTLANLPTQQAAGASISSAQGGSATVTWTRGNGADCIVLVSAGSPVNSAPVGGTTYTANTDFGSGSQIGTGNYVAYIGTGSSVTLTALTPGATYDVAVYEFNGSGSSVNYLTSSPATGSGATVLHPVVYYSTAAASDPTQTNSWWTGTSGDGANPADFAEGDTFIIQTNDNYTIASGAIWAVNATNNGTAATVQVNNGGTLTFDNSNTSGSPYLQLGGNFAQNGAIAQSGSSSVAYIEFTSSGTWTGSANLTPARLSVIVDTNATLDASGVTTGFIFKSTNQHGLRVADGGTLNAGTFQISGNSATGSAYFKLQDGGTLITASTRSGGVPGIFTAFAPGSVTLSAAANYVFDGTAAQTTGTANSDATMPATVNNLVISNSAGVTLSQSTTVNGTFAVAPGASFDFNSNTLTVAGTSLSGTSALKMEVTKTGQDAFAGSQLTQTAGTLAYSGTLNVVETGGAFQAGDVIPLFNATSGDYAGGFSTVTGLTAPAGLVINSSQLTPSATGGNILVSCDGSLSASAAPSASICGGGSYSLGGSAAGGGGAYSYSWSSSPAGFSYSGLNPTVSPASTTTYTLTVTDGNGCTATAPVTVTVNPPPMVSVNSPAVCAGSSATLTATTSSTNASYLWSDSETTASITVSPAATTTYTVVVTDGTTGCANSGSGTVTVNPSPTLTLDVTNQTVCAGSVVTWSVGATGSGLSYQWMRDGSNLVEGVDNFTGTTSATLTNSAVGTQDSLTATNGYVCMISIGNCSLNSSLAALTVNPLPTVSVNSATVCAGSPATLTATTSSTNASYLWSDSETTVSITVSPATTTTYTVVVTDGTTGCANSGSGTVTVNPLPTVSVNSATVCSGSPATLTATTSSTNASYLWSDSETTASITVSPAATTTYTVVVTDGTTGCANSGSGTVTMNPLPTVSVNSATVCAGSPATLTATTSSTNASYLWSDSETTASITVSPAATTTYTVVVTDGTTGCANSGSGTVTVYPEATASAGANQIIYAVNSTAGLGGVVGGGATGGVWSSSGTGIFSPNASTLNATYQPSLADAVAGSVTLTLTSTGQLSPCGPAVAQVVVTINPLPVVLTGTRPYDGTTAAAASILEVSNAVPGDDVSVASGSATLASSWVGTNAITSLTGLTLGGTKAPKYTLSGASGAVIVTNPDLPFAITSATLDATRSNLILVWASIPGAAYQVSSSTNLGISRALWTPVGSPISATATTTTNSVPMSGLPPWSFFDVFTH